MTQITSHVEQLGPPPAALRRKEIGVVTEFVKGATRSLFWQTQSPENKGVVIVLPGFGSDTRFMFTIKRLLKGQGYQVKDWQLGWNDGNVYRLLPRMIEIVRSIFESSGQTITLLGWSLGGYIARETARECPAAVKQVITMGTPVVGGPKCTVAAAYYEKKGWSLKAIEQETIERFATPISRPITAIYSKQDGIVNWEACIDNWSPYVEHFQVSCPHLGMAFSPEVLNLIKQSLD